MSEQRNIMDQGFEVLCTGLEMIDAIVEEYERCHPRHEPRVKTDNPGTFEESLEESEEQHGKDVDMEIIADIQREQTKNIARRLSE